MKKKTYLGSKKSPATKVGVALVLRPGLLVKLLLNLYNVTEINNIDSVI